MMLLRKLLPPLLSGILFGAGLTISGMTDPPRVRGFLDVFGEWDPTLAFVMGGAVAIMAVAWRLQARIPSPLFGEKFSLPDRKDLDARLIGGAILFGIGWGIAGLCPGPAVAALALSPLSAAPFLGAMLAGMLLQGIIMNRKGRGSDRAKAPAFLTRCRKAMNGPTAAPPVRRGLTGRAPANPLPANFRVEPRIWLGNADQ
jgi:uncharacterized protein